MSADSFASLCTEELVSALNPPTLHLRDAGEDLPSPPALLPCLRFDPPTLKAFVEKLGAAVFVGWVAMLSLPVKSSIAGSNDTMQTSQSEMGLKPVRSFRRTPPSSDENDSLEGVGPWGREDPPPDDREELSSVPPAAAKVLGVPATAPPITTTSRAARTSSTNFMALTTQEKTLRFAVDPTTVPSWLSVRPMNGTVVPTEGTAFKIRIRGSLSKDLFEASSVGSFLRSVPVVHVQGFPAPFLLPVW